MVEGTGAAPDRLDPEALGRGAQWKLLREAIETVHGAGRAVWLCGEAGAGKTVLLEQAGELAAHRGLRLLRIHGAEGERNLPFAALHQWVWPLSEEVRELPRGARAALERALGTGSGEAAGPYTVAAATLDLLGVVARRRPAALLIDDLHWIDASSAEVLHFVQRRLAALPVVLLATVRQEALAATDTTGVRVLGIGPLGDEPARALLRRLHPGLSDPARHRILQESAGNPLALAELPAQLRAEERSGRLPLPERLPLGERLGRMFTRRVTALPASARFLLLLCALAGRDGQALSLVVAAAEAAGAGTVAEDLAAAEDSGLLVVDARTRHVRFRHPLVRSSLVESARGTELRRAHAALAEVLPEGELRRLTHRAAATVAADETLAAALDEAAARTQARGGATEAALLYARAAGLSADADSRGRRLVAAACASSTSGHLDRASRLLDQTLAHGVPQDSRHLLHFTRALVRLHADGDMAPAVELLPAVLDRLPGAAGAALRLPSLFMLYLAAGYTADSRVWEAIAVRLDGTGTFARLAHDVWSDPVRRAHGAQERFDAALETFSEDAEAGEFWLLLWAAAGLDGLDDEAPLFRRLAHRHSYSTQAFLGNVCAYGDYLRGRWDRCVERAREGATAARVRAFGLNEAVLRYTEGYVLAARGQRQAVEDLVTSLRPWAAARGLTFVLQRLRAMQALCALALGDHETAYGHTSSITPPGTFPPGVTKLNMVFLDLVESAVHTGRRQEALRHVVAGRAAGLGRISAHHAFVLRAAEAMVADDVDAGCTAVYASPGAAHWPFELARVRLHHGAWLRRQGRRVEARQHLDTARRAFAGLAAGPWADRAGQELQVCDEPAPTAAARPVGDLTAQERRIADLVARGLTNREIGARLQLSPRTVAGHLYRIYPKLGITSRAGVARALGGHEPP
ncbi:ATP-binding protein [Streptomyces sp. NPDC085946]|uniref:ATP-binding protein n=1 Tax=Streptomyces sp. NPDC085946 TaxID=3365744 RepID=UPI0037D85E13